MLYHRIEFVLFDFYGVKHTCVPRYCTVYALCNSVNTRRERFVTVSVVACKFLNNRRVRKSPSERGFRSLQPVDGFGPHETVAFSSQLFLFVSSIDRYVAHYFLEETSFSANFS